MKALITTGYGDVDRLTVADFPEPQIGPGDVKVKVHAASINPMDWKLLSGQARTAPLPVQPESPEFTDRSRMGFTLQPRPPTLPPGSGYSGSEDCAAV